MDHPALQKLKSLGAISLEEERALLDALSPPHMVPRGTNIVSDGDTPSRSAVLLGGLACRYKALSDGRRQILSFQMAGDLVDLHAYGMRRLDHSIGTLTACKVSYVAHADLNAILQRFPNLGLALWRDTLMDSAIFREGMIGIGRRNAHQRVAHLICELVHRWRIADLGKYGAFPFPISQAVLADALALSSVHVNRVLQRLRAEEIISLAHGVLRIRDEAGLIRAGDFDPSYLETPEASATRLRRARGRPSTGTPTGLQGSP